MGVPGEGAESAARARANALLAARQYQQAVAEARAGLATNPEDPDLLVILSMALCELEDGTGACDAAQRAIALAPDWARAHAALGDAHLMVTRNGHAAFNAYNTAARLDPEQYTYFTGRAQATLFMLPRRQVVEVQTKSRRTEMIQSAERDAEYAVRLAPNSALAHAVKARVYLAGGQAFLAKACSERALSIDPTYSFAMQTRGLALQQLGDVRGASEAFVAAGKQDPRSGSSIGHLRKLKVAAPVSLLVVFIASRLVLASAETGSTAGYVFAGFVVGAALLAYVIWRVQRFRQLTPEAQRALRVDRKLRRSKRFHKWIQWVRLCLPQRRR